MTLHKRRERPVLLSAGRFDSVARELWEIVGEAWDCCDYAVIQVRSSRYLLHCGAVCGEKSQKTWNLWDWLVSAGAALYLVIFLLSLSIWRGFDLRFLRVHLILKRCALTKGKRSRKKLLRPIISQAIHVFKMRTGQKEAIRPRRHSQVRFHTGPAFIE